MSVFCECCVLSGRGLCDGLISRPEESYRLWCVELSVIVKPHNEEALAHEGLLRHGGFIFALPHYFASYGTCCCNLHIHEFSSLNVGWITRYSNCVSCGFVQSVGAVYLKGPWSPPTKCIPTYHSHISIVLHPTL